MTATFAVDKKKILKNTLYLYIRMLVMVGLNFYTVHLLLACLGVDDFGLYNLLFGFVTIFSLLNGALMNMTQRYICYELGRNKIKNAQKNFTISLLLFCAGILIFTVLAETVGLWFFYNKLQIPADRFDAAKIVYQVSILCFIGKILQSPFMAIITAYEKMSVFARISILETVFLFAFVCILPMIPTDKLILFSALYALTALLICAAYAAYSFKYLAACRVTFHFSIKRVGAMAAYFSWNILGAAANISRNQGLNVLLNIFFSVTLNASWAISQKVCAVANQIAGNFQLAFNPQILKAYTLPDKKDFYNLIISTTRYSFCLLWLVVLPLLLQTEFLLKLWLGNNLPPDLVIFTKITALVILFHGINGPLWTAAIADGKVGHYQLCISCLIASSFFLSWVLLYLGFPAYWVPVSMGIADALCLLYRIVYLMWRYAFPIWEYIRHAVLQMCGVAMLTLVLSALCRKSLAGGFWLELVFLVCLELINGLVMLFLGLNKKERKALFAKMKNMIPGGAA